MPQTLILASTSRYRGELLSRICRDFDQHAPICDETPLPGEAPDALALRLARGKSLSVAEQFPDAIVIGSDQVSSLEGTKLGKPGDHETAVTQLTACSGKTVDFYTSVCIRKHADNRVLEYTDHTRVHFKDLSAELIENYLRAEQPYDCAGSFKSEGLGVVLFERIENNDPTALIGLPLVWVGSALLEFSVPLLSDA